MGGKLRNPRYQHVNEESRKVKFAVEREEKITFLKLQFPLKNQQPESS